MTIPNLVVILYQGRVYRIPKVPFETEEQAQDRAWYIAQKHTDPAVTSSFAEIVSESFETMYTKFYHIKY